MLNENFVKEYKDTSSVDNYKFFAKKPTWMHRGIEKVVKIGYEYFNYIDYLEAWCGIDCHTYRKEASMVKIRNEIKEALKAKK